ncbi:hypothetical protein SLA2020_035870 [Shorea laevis]
MRNLVFLARKLQRLYTHSFIFLIRLNPFWIHLTYFIAISLFGYLALKKTKPRSNSFTPNDLDTIFTSVSAATVSSMSTVEMEAFSIPQLITITVMMLLGGEVFTSILGLLLARATFLPKQPRPLENSSGNDKIELGLVTRTEPNKKQLPCLVMGSTLDVVEQYSISTESHKMPRESQNSCASDKHLTVSHEKNLETNTYESLSWDVLLKYNSIRCLSYVVLGYFLVVHVSGFVLVSTYVNLVPSAEEVLKTRGIPVLIFSVFTIVSTFSNCGFIPTNENMIIFKKNAGLLLLLIPQSFLGNTLYPVFLRILICALGKISKRGEFRYILRNSRELGFGHLLSGIHSCFLAATVIGFVLIQLIPFCSMEWNLEDLNGLTWYEKSVASLFQVVNSRHTGESVVDLSAISPAILVVFVVMMYLPPYTSFFPRKYRKMDSENNKDDDQIRSTFVESLIFSQLSYLVIFIVLVCITEREKMKDDPLNFNVLNITLEVISAYGNVGFSTGYGCKRQLKPQSYCVDRWYGFVGRWSDKGKWVLILVMFFGRLKKFNMNGGKAWILS